MAMACLAAMKSKSPPLFAACHVATVSAFSSTSKSERSSTGAAMTRGLPSSQLSARFQHP